jgi:regulator of sirC expression with transglutaminase-like and TPR domain
MLTNADECKVLERRKGNPITISVIYMAVARRVGVAVLLCMRP